MRHSAGRAFVGRKAEVSARFVDRPGNSRRVNGFLSRNLLPAYPALQRHGQPLEAYVTGPTMPCAVIPVTTAAHQVGIQNGGEGNLDSRPGLFKRFDPGFVARAFKTKRGWLPAADRGKPQAPALSERRLPVPSLYGIPSALDHPFALDFMPFAPGSNCCQQVRICEVLGVNRVKVIQWGSAANLKRTEKRCPVRHQRSIELIPNGSSFHCRRLQGFAYVIVGDCHTPRLQGMPLLAALEILPSTTILKRSEAGFNQ